MTPSAPAQERPHWAEVQNPYLQCPGIISEMLDEIYRDVQEEMDTSAVMKNTLLHAQVRTDQVEDENAALRAELDSMRQRVRADISQLREDFAVRVEVAETLAATAAQQATEWKQQATEWKQQASEWKQQAAELRQRIESLEKLSKRPRMTEA